ncbi:AIPR family protein [Treponema primitia]|uniref:AIPR family protein n=1 Tax=Treponema primitia TaxID=88058 RepID=UPI00025550A6|nr:AIPR family protein [Treponema primitia]
MSNDIILLNSTLNQLHSQMANSMTESDFFGLFVAEQIIKDYDLTYEEIEDGIVDGGDDGGIDAIFIFIDHELLTTDFEIETVKKSPNISIFLLQSKTSSSFSEIQIATTISSLLELFDLSKKEKDLKDKYNSKILNKVFLFRNAYISLSTKHPVLNIKYIYATKGDKTTIHHKVKSKGDQLRKELMNTLSGSDVEVKYFGARELLDLERVEKKYTLQLKFEENYISREDNYIVLSNLYEYYLFVSDNDNLRNYIFEFNVRDYEGNVEVNKDIENSLIENKDIDFWNLNNGITIICSKATIVGKTISMDDVQIVNGLQSTHIIFKYLSSRQDKNDEKRSILIKIIVTNDAARMDKIIKATNFQTRIKDTSFKATNNIQRDIEKYFYQNGWYYERRKNFYRNAHKPFEKIISISYLAQSVLTIILKEPNNARGRPTTLLKRDEDYQKIFNKNLDYSIFLFCARLMKEIDKFIKSKKMNVPWQDLSNAKFHIALQFLFNLLSTDYNVNDIDKIKNNPISTEELEKAAKIIIKKIKTYNSKTIDISPDKIVKSKEFLEYLLKTQPNIARNKL